VKLIRNKCEIEGCEERENLHLHHICERTEVNTTNHPMNLAILCANHHGYTHSGRLKVIGVYPGSRLPNGRILVYVLDGTANVPGIVEPYVTFKNKSIKV